MPIGKDVYPIANGSAVMYDQLTKEMPLELRSREDHATCKGSRVDLHLFGLSCMQLAAKLGDHMMLRHMLRHMLMRPRTHELPLEET